MRHPMPVQIRGITILEILIALGVLVVFLSFATPSISGAAARADFRAAVENVEMSLHMARNTSRVLNTDVLMHIEAGQRGEADIIRFSLPARQGDLEAQSMLQDYRLPESVDIESEERVIRFDFRGMPEFPVAILLVSNMDSKINQRLLIQ